MFISLASDQNKYRNHENFIQTANDPFFAHTFSGYGHPPGFVMHVAQQSL
jgi:hypothetical protein